MQAAKGRGRQSRGKRFKKQNKHQKPHKKHQTQQEVRKRRKEEKRKLPLLFLHEKLFRVKTKERRNPREAA